MTELAEAAIKSLKPCINCQASAIRCHHKRQQALADNDKRLSFELMAILLEKHAQVCYIDFFLVIYLVAHFSTAWSHQRFSHSWAIHKFPDSQKQGSHCSHSKAESLMCKDWQIMWQGRSKQWNWSSCKYQFCSHIISSWLNCYKDQVGKAQLIHTLAHDVRQYGYLLFFVALAIIL